MKLRFPLYAKILTWFFLNLLLLGAVFYGFFGSKLHVGFNSLLAGAAEDRIEGLVRLIENELKDAPRSSWDAILEKFGAAYQGVEFYIFRPDGKQIAGAPLTLPAEMKMRLATMRPPLAFPPPENPLRFLRQQQQRANLVQPLRLEPNPPRSHPKFMGRTENPVRYWVGIRLFPMKRTILPMAVESEVLFAVSNTLSGGGLFFDVTSLVIIAFGALALSMLFWFPLVHGITRSISQITRATEQVAEGNFEIRVDAERRDELGRLGQGVNAMAERLSGFVHGQKRFLGDAAHELSSPLARIEVALSILETRADTALQTRIADVREEAQEMGNLVNEILAFSKASLRGNEIRLEPVPVAELVQRVAARETHGASTVQVEIAGGLYAMAAPGLLSRAVANLIRNALRYAGGENLIVVSAESQDRQIVLKVTDSGPGVPEEDLQRIFDPFFRLDSSRSRDTGGFGLGLSIVKTCIQACGGSVMARNVKPTGLQVEISLAESSGNHDAASAAEASVLPGPVFVAACPPDPAKEEGHK